LDAIYDEGFGSTYNNVNLSNNQAVNGGGSYTAGGIATFNSGQVTRNTASCCVGGIVEALQQRQHDRLVVGNGHNAPW